MKRSDVYSAVKEFCRSNQSRQREDLYEFLNERLGLILSVYDYEGTNDHARFACDEESQKHETDYVMRKLG